ncbi:MAG: RluA family pseudouridine synthase [Dehalococcoidia bacterium]|nr:RluA family pseudouridine synthase [Dehalococcoidia bacterium]
MLETANNLHYTVDQPGARLDKYLSEKCPELSRTQAQKLIEEGLVTVNGQLQKASYRLAAGAQVRVRIPPPAPSHLIAEDIPIPILYEDEDILVVDKPAGMTVHPAPGNPEHTLVNAILARLKNIPGGTERPGIVHRLDKDTSGVMVVAKNPAAHETLAAQFKGHTVTKVYLALVRGRLTPAEGIIEAHIGRDTGDRKKMAVAAESRGRQARTRYKVLRYLDDYTYLEVMPETGRTHQIRVHLSAIGYPVVGDATYGVKSPFLSRQFLHAHKLGFRLPLTGEYVEFTAALPPELERALKEIGQV